MPQYKEVDDHIRERFEEALNQLESVLKPEVYQTLVEHISTVKQQNRGNTSTAHTTARSTHPPEPMDITINSIASSSTRRHELGHTLADAYGYDTSSEASQRAQNKSNYSRWPQFSFGNKDSPAERFMLSAYGELDELTRHEIDEFDEDRCDTFVVDDTYVHPNGYRPQADTKINRQTKQRMGYTDPFMDTMVDVTPHFTTGTRTISRSDVELIDRYELTPGLGAVTGADEPERSGFARVMQEVNRHWYKAATLVRKRGEKRERGKRMAPRGASSSYYLMNAHEYFAELTAVMTEENYTDINRLLDECPDLVLAYDHVLLDSHEIRARCEVCGDHSKDWDTSAWGFDKNHTDESCPADDACVVIEHV